MFCNVPNFVTMFLYVTTYNSDIWISYSLKLLLNMDSFVVHCMYVLLDFQMHGLNICIRVYSLDLRE